MSLVSQINQDAQKVSSKCGLRKHHSLLPRRFFCPFAFTKGCYFHSPVTFTITKSKMANTEVRLWCTSNNPVFARPKIRVHYLQGLCFPFAKWGPFTVKRPHWYQRWAWGNVRLNFVCNMPTVILLKKGHGKTFGTLHLFSENFRWNDSNSRVPFSPNLISRRVFVNGKSSTLSIQTSLYRSPTTCTTIKVGRDIATFALHSCADRPGEVN